MADLLGLGLTHYSGLRFVDADMSIFLRKTLSGSRMPARMTDPANWPPAMREEWANDQGTAAAAAHRKRHVDAFARMRAELKRFRPDLIVMWGDDQYENFVEDVVPPFCVYILDEIRSTPFAPDPHQPAGPNPWGEPADKVFVHRGHPRGAAYLAEKLSDRGMDVPYSYRLRHHRGLAHAFINTLMYLDYGRRGFEIPIVPFHVNCYGGDLIRTQGGHLAPGEERDRLDPPAPSARACFELGRAIGAILADSPWRVALVASSSWSHAFLTEKNYWLYPDHETDRVRLAELRAGDYAKWRDLSRAEIQSAGQHEFLNWICLAGAMSAFQPKIEIIDYLESHVMNSNKCFAVLRP
jgi:hypothetical protein